MSRHPVLSRFALALLALAFATGFVAVRDGAGDETTILVTTDWVAEHLQDHDLVLLHVGNEYDNGHIPGARLVERPMIAQSRDGLSLQVLPVEELERNLEALGISNDSRVVIYTGNDWMTMVARVYLTLDYLGLGPQTSIMDGGMLAWKAEGRPLTIDVPEASTGDLTPRPNPALIASADWLGQNLDDPSLVIIDARTPRYYSGARGGHGQPRAGHIAGAHNIPFSSVVDDETMKFKNIDELRSMFEAAGAEPGDKVVSYCHIGQQASLVYVTAKYLGYDAAMYDGSFQEWSNLEQLPVERPAAATMPKLISTAELAALIGNEHVTILDVRSNLVGYLEGHIPGASYVHYESLRATRAGVPADLLGADAYAFLFSQLGVDRDRPVVIYSDGNSANFNATFLAWILEAFSHPSIRLLDGGYAKWTEENRPTSRSYPETEATEFSADGFDPTRASLDWVVWTVEHAGTPDGDAMVLVDVRPADQYAGRAGPQARRGHIPGAINHLWSSDLVERGESKVWKPEDELLASYEAQGITRDKHVILYCNTGTEASHAYFALKNLLGYPNVDVYFPSWTEWAERADLPIETAVASR
jgi:thiosulfate/3-mercaptopyruvate sulfurtransferase